MKRNNFLEAGSILEDPGEISNYIAIARNVIDNIK